LITNDVSDYINVLVRIAHIICNYPILNTKKGQLLLMWFTRHFPKYRSYMFR